MITFNMPAPRARPLRTRSSLRRFYRPRQNPSEGATSVVVVEQVVTSGSEVGPTRWSQLYNSAGFKQLKNKTYLDGYIFADEAKGASEIEKTAQEAMTASPVEQPQDEPIVTIQPDVITSCVPETIPLPENTSVLPVEHKSGHSAEQFYDDRPNRPTQVTKSPPTSSAK